MILRSALRRLFPLRFPLPGRNIASAPRRHASRPSKTVVVPPSTAWRRFWRVVAAADDAFDVDDAWIAYDALGTRRASLSATQRLDFADRVLARAEQLYVSETSTETLHQWGYRLLDVLHDLDPRDGFGEYRRRCLVLKATALVGNLEEASALASRLPFSLVDAVTHLDHKAQAYHALLASTFRHFGAPAALEFLVTEWDSFGPPSAPLSSRLSALPVVYVVLEHIVDPAVFLATRGAWPRPMRQRLAHLFLEVLCEQRLPNDAYAVLSIMREQGLEPPVMLLRLVVRALAREDAFELANALFDTLPDAPGKFHLSTALYLFAHQGDVVRARAYYARIEQLGGVVDPSAMALLLQAYAVARRKDEVVSVFGALFPGAAPRPGVVHFTIVMYAHALLGDFEGVTHWFERMTDAGIEPDLYVYNTLLKAYGQKGDLEGVHSVLDHMRAARVEPGVEAYTIVISLLAIRRDPFAAEAVYRRAVEEGITPDRRMLTAVMDAHVEAGSWAGAIRVFDYIKSGKMRRLQLSIEVYNTLLKAYVLIGAPFKLVMRIFARLEDARVRPDARTYALLIQSACDSKLMKTACDIFVEMEKRSEEWPPTLRINQYVMTVIMSGFLRRGQKTRAAAVYGDMLKRGIDPTSVTYGAILRMYANSKSEKSLQLAEAFLKELTNPDAKKRAWDVPTGDRRSALDYLYSPLMQFYAQQERAEDVERLYQDMLDHGGQPTLGLLCTLLDVHRRLGNIETVKQVWSQIYREALRHLRIDSLITPSDGAPNLAIHRQAHLLCVPLSIYIDALSAAGRHAEISATWRLLQVQGFSFDAHNWNHLAVALVRSGEPERAFEVLETVILPQHWKRGRFADQREAVPETPLTFDLPPDPLPSTWDRRSWVTKDVVRKPLMDLFDDEQLLDFAHPLHILQQVSPEWNSWQPHKAVTGLLILVLQHLRSGKTLQPLKPGQRVLTPVRDPEQRAAMRVAARGIFQRILDNYPNTVAFLTEMEQTLNVQIR